MIAASEETVSNYTRTDVIIFAAGYDQRSSPAVMQLGTPYPGEPSPSPCLRQSPTNPLCLGCCPNSGPIYIGWRLHNDRHPQPVHKARLRVRANQAIGKNSLSGVPTYIDEVTRIRFYKSGVPRKSEGDTRCCTCTETKAAQRAAFATSQWPVTGLLKTSLLRK